ncbi:hypothetical protein HYH03_014846 [Edaphochlamys debaryana]|uniref:Uncharacterized protein n=1 Tax=Edaphochlamys debaryana TaxID=47281 RepID=A0A835XTC4_9CHLO|nr:hypothetical protein HYH03_014846 [Edaphochlamys debaryana]|eukprot:KAG2486545.1 hypothetical protein HYH03_014846 [Edaphochlamys debaryana]
MVGFHRSRHTRSTLTAWSFTLSRLITHGAGVRLTHLNVNCYLLTPAAAALVARGCPALQTLSLSYTTADAHILHPTDPEEAQLPVQSLALLFDPSSHLKLPQLRRLELAGVCDLQPLEAVPAARLGRLASLCIRDCYIPATEADGLTAQSYAELGRLSSLTDLELGDTRLRCREALLLALASASRLTRLEACCEGPGGAPGTAPGTPGLGPEGGIAFSARDFAHLSGLRELTLTDARMDVQGLGELTALTKLRVGSLLPPAQPAAAAAAGATPLRAAPQALPPAPVKAGSRLAAALGAAVSAAAAAKGAESMDLTPLRPSSAAAAPSPWPPAAPAAASAAAASSAPPAPSARPSTNAAAAPLPPASVPLPPRLQVLSLDRAEGQSLALLAALAPGPSFRCLEVGAFDGDPDASGHPTPFRLDLGAQAQGPGPGWAHVDPSTGELTAEGEAALVGAVQLLEGRLQPPGALTVAFGGGGGDYAAPRPLLRPRRAEGPAPEVATAFADVAGCSGAGEGRPSPSGGGSGGGGCAGADGEGGGETVGGEGHAPWLRALGRCGLRRLRLENVALGAGDVDELVRSLPELEALEVFGPLDECLVPRLAPLRRLSHLRLAVDTWLGPARPGAPAPRACSRPLAAAVMVLIHERARASAASASSSSFSTSSASSPSVNGGGGGGTARSCEGGSAPAPPPEPLRRLDLVWRRGVAGAAQLEAYGEQISMRTEAGDHWCVCDQGRRLARVVRLALAGAGVEVRAVWARVPPAGVSGATAGGWA